MSSTEPHASGPPLVPPFCAVELAPWHWKTLFSLQAAQAFISDRWEGRESRGRLLAPLVPQRALYRHVEEGADHAVVQPAAIDIPTAVLPRRIGAARVVLADGSVQCGVGLPMLHHRAAPMAADEAVRHDGLVLGLCDVGEVLREVPARGAELVDRVVEPVVLTVHAPIH